MRLNLCSVVKHPRVQCPSRVVLSLCSQCFRSLPAPGVLRRGGPWDGGGAQLCPAPTLPHSDWLGDEGPASVGGLGRTSAHCSPETDLGRVCVCVSARVCVCACVCLRACVSRGVAPNSGPYIQDVLKPLMLDLSYERKHNHPGLYLPVIFTEVTGWDIFFYLILEGIKQSLKCHITYYQTLAKNYNQTSIYFNCGCDIFPHLHPDKTVSP